MKYQESQYKIIRLIEEEPDLTQRELAKRLGVSLGKVNYCVQGLIKRGLLTAKRFSQSDNKRAYIYILTPQGLDARARMTVHFLKRKMAEYEILQKEIESLKQEVNDSSEDIK